MKRLNEQITGNTAMVFHGSKYKEVYKYLCEGQWKTFSGVYGDGLYTVYNLNGTQTEEGRYGNYILKLYIGDLSKYWCFTWATFQKVHPIWAKHTNEEDFIDYQAEKFKLKKNDYPEKLGDFYEQHRYYSKFLETVDGIVYHGEHDGDCILSYNPYNCRPIAISSDKGTTWEKIDEKYIQQYKQILPNTKLDKNFYMNNSKLAHLTISNDDTEIEDYAFEYNEYIGSITISNSITKIGEYAFSDCANLAHITIPDSVTDIKNGAFYYCKNLTNITIPDSVTEIRKGVFNGCEKLSKVTIPNSVTYIGEYAFANCFSLKHITIPDSVTEIKSFAFGSCINLRYVKIPYLVTKIEDSTFYDCRQLKYVIIPNSITKIGENAFNSCINLTNITIPISVTKIGENAFSTCKQLTEINYEGTESEWNQIEGIDKIGWNGVVNFNA